MGGIDQVHKAISQIDEVTQQNAALVEETAAAADSMNEQAESMDRNMAFFKTGQTITLQPAKKAEPEKRAQASQTTSRPACRQRRNPAKPANRKPHRTSLPKRFG